MSKLRLIFPLFTMLFLSTAPSSAFFFFKKNNYENLNSEIFIETPFKANDGIYKPRVVMLIPEGLDHMTVSVSYDQLKEKKIVNLAWVRGGLKSRNWFGFFHNHRTQNKAKFERVYPFKKEFFRKESYIYDEKHPDKDYDRLMDEEFEVYKIFHFDKKEVFGNGIKKTDHLLEFEFADGSHKAIRIKDKVYRDEDRLRPEDRIIPFSSKALEKKYSHKYAPYPALSKRDIKRSRTKHKDFVRQQNTIFREERRAEYDRLVEDLQTNATILNEDLPEFDGYFSD